MNELLVSHAEKALLALQESNKHARKRNRIAKREYRQSVLNYEQAERQYLIQKSHLQPSFRLLASEFLTCEPDFMNDPEQASEAKYLADLGLGVDQRVLRITVRAKGEAEYMQPNLIVEKTDKSVASEIADSMSELLYFATIDSLQIGDKDHSFLAYFVYRDKTTLPVVHKYRLTQQPDSTLRRWDVLHLDTVYVSSHKSLSRLNSSSGCAALFDDRDQAE